MNKKTKLKIKNQSGKNRRHGCEKKKRSTEDTS